MKYAVAEEEARLARAGLLDDPEHNQWLFVLQIVQQGVYAEIAKGINRYIDHIGYVLRMETPRQRRMLLKQLIDVMPTMDVRPFVQVVDNIVGSLGDGSQGDFDGVDTLGGMTNQLLQLRRDVQDFLPAFRLLNGGNGEGKCFQVNATLLCCRVVAVKAMLFKKRLMFLRKVNFGRCRMR